MKPLIKQVAVRMSAEDLAIMRRLQKALGLRSQSEVLRMALRSLKKEHDRPRRTTCLPRLQPR